VANYLITGAAGFIASRVASLLLDDGHTVYGVDNLNDAYDPRMKSYRLKDLREQESFTFQQMDISDKEAVADLAQHGPFDAVINLAARAGVRASVKDPWVYLATNTTGTLNLLELCKNNNIPKFILASTSSVYGADAPLPTPETAESKLPLQPYAASKVGAEAMAHAYHYLFDIDVTVVRYFTVYGPAGRPDMVMFRFAKWIMEDHPLQLNGDGTQTRGFTYLDDIARGTILALKPVGYEIINLGGHEVISINDLIALMEEIIGKKATIEHREFHKADMMTNHADVSKAGRLLGWEPQMGLEVGVKKMIAWYRDNQDWAKDIDTGA
jgi:nucleoside-diphosphate-sugar epimerase